MDFKILFLILMIGDVIAAPWGATFNQTSASVQFSQGAVNNTLMATLAAPTPRGIPTTTGNAISSVLTSLFPGTAPLSLPPDTVNSTLLPAPATSSPAIALSTSAPVVTSTQVASVYTLTIIETETDTNFATTSHAASNTTGPILSHGSHGGPLVTSSPFSYGSYGGPTFTGSAVPTTLRNSTIINGSSVSPMCSSRASFNSCEKEPHRCPNINGTKGSESSFGTLPEESPTNDFEVKVTVKGGNFRGGRPFESTGKYQGNCTNGVISTGMGVRPVDIHKLCGNDWMCWAGQLIAYVGSAVTEIMSPATQGTNPTWCPDINGIGTDNATKSGGSGSGMAWSASETGKWNTSMASAAMTQTQTQETPIGMPMAPTSTRTKPSRKSTALETSPSTSFSAMISATVAPTGAESMVTDTAVPSTSQRGVKPTIFNLHSMNPVANNEVSAWSAIFPF